MDMEIIEESEVRKMVRKAWKVLEYLGLKKEVRRVVIFFKADRAV